MSISKGECFIHQIYFYSGQEILVQVGEDDDYVKRWGERVESFEIAGDEQLIGCELDFCKDYFRGVTWLKWKIMNWKLIWKTKFI